MDLNWNRQTLPFRGKLFSSLDLLLTLFLLWQVAAQTIKSCLDNLPGYPRTQIGFITYDSTLHFYNMKVIEF